MKPAVTTLLILLLFATISAQATKPALPRVPRGFDEGRTAFVQETGEGLLQPKALVERMFEQADLTELASFVHLHLLVDEKRALAETLKLEGLINCKDALSVQALFGERKPADIAGAIGDMLVARKYTLGDVGAWLYARGFNFNVLQRAMNGERLDALRLRRQLRAMDKPKAATLFTTGIWEFNLDDSREEKGGTYNGPQVVEALLSLGWGSSDFAALAGTKELSAPRRKLVEWGDARLVWAFLESYLSESELIARVQKRLEGKEDAVMQLALARAATTLRWFRTGGPGVSGVYRGPWPGTREDTAPVSRAHAIGDVDAEQFAAALDQSLEDHFAKSGDHILLVTYDDGSARAYLDKPRREPIKYTADTPFGAVESTRQAYEGRVSITGRNGLLYLVFSADGEAAPPEIEFANVKLAAGGAFLAADIDDGINLTPILLRRVNRLVE